LESKIIWKESLTVSNIIATVQTSHKRNRTSTTLNSSPTKKRPKRSPNHTTELRNNDKLSPHFSGTNHRQSPRKLTPRSNSMQNDKLSPHSEPQSQNVTAESEEKRAKDLILEAKQLKHSADAADLNQDDKVMMYLNAGLKYLESSYCKENAIRLYQLKKRLDIAANKERELIETYRSIAKFFAECALVKNTAPYYQGLYYICQGISLYRAYSVYHTRTKENLQSMLQTRTGNKRTVSERDLKALKSLRDMTDSFDAWEKAREKGVNTLNFNCCSSLQFDSIQHFIRQALQSNR